MGLGIVVFDRYRQRVEGDDGSIIEPYGFDHGEMTLMKKQELMRDPARKELVNAMKTLMKHHTV